MEPITIRLDYRTRYMRILSAVLIFLGLLLIVLHFYEYATNELSDRWLYSIVIASFAIVGGIFIRKGYSMVQQPELVIDKEGIKSQKTSIWDKSAKWSDLKSVSLDKSHIHIQYRQSGAHDKIHLPVYTESQHNKIEEKLNEAASEYNLEFKQN